MANEAHKEPTMEEILASIRKIISDDEPSAARAAAPVLREVAPPAMNDFDLGDDMTAVPDEGMFEVEAIAGRRPPAGSGQSDRA